MELLRNTNLGHAISHYIVNHLSPLTDVMGVIYYVPIGHLNDSQIDYINNIVNVIYPQYRRSLVGMNKSKLYILIDRACISIADKLPMSNTTLSPIDGELNNRFIPINSLK